jgi:hypothetical protein
VQPAQRAVTISAFRAQAHNPPGRLGIKHGREVVARGGLGHAPSLRSEVAWQWMSGTSCDLCRVNRLA